MRQTFIICATAIGLMSAPLPASAGGNNVAAGVLGGLAAGAIIGGALAQPQQPAPYGYYGPVGAPAYGPPPPRGCIEAREVWSDRYQGYVVRNVRVPCY
ncbi:MAG: hypothetical protein WCG92_22805 [Hyphomicrobiales bacterium]|nr:hypothetical protein [Alphaproteobacteria bacterium]